MLFVEGVIVISSGTEIITLHQVIRIIKEATERKDNLRIRINLVRIRVEVGIALDDGGILSGSIGHGHIGPLSHAAL